MSNRQSGTQIREQMWVHGWLWEYEKWEDAAPVTAYKVN